MGDGAGRRGCVRTWAGAVSGIGAGADGGAGGATMKAGMGMLAMLVSTGEGRDCSAVAPSTPAAKAPATSACDHGDHRREGVRIAVGGCGAGVVGGCGAGVVGGCGAGNDSAVSLIARIP